MPLEERFITFSMDEVYKAVMILCERDDLPKPPAGEILSIELEAKPEGDEQDLICLQVKRAEDGEEERVKFFRKFFAQSLVFFCQGSGIPLPRAGQKILAVADDKIVMKVILN